MDKKVTDVLLDRVKYFINAIENGNSETELLDYDFTINLTRNGGRKITISDNYFLRN